MTGDVRQQYEREHTTGGSPRGGMVRGGEQEVKSVGGVGGGVSQGAWSGKVVERMSRSSSVSMNTASLNPSTQSFETTYQQPSSGSDAVGTPPDVARGAPVGIRSAGMTSTGTTTATTTTTTGTACGTNSNVAGTGMTAANMGTANNASSGLQESRIVCVSGIDPVTPDGVILHEFENFGDVHSIHSQDIKSGYVVIVYHDIRAARLALTSAGTQWRGRRLSCTMLDEAVGRQVYNTPLTSLYLVSLEYGGAGSGGATGDAAGMATTDVSIMDDMFYLLSGYGELKELKRDMHSRQECCVAEFFDSRHAMMAYRGLKSMEGLGHRLLVLDAWEIGISGGGQSPGSGGGGSSGGWNRGLQGGGMPGGQGMHGQANGQNGQNPMSYSTSPPATSPQHLGTLVHSASTPVSMSFSYPQHGGYFGGHRSSAHLGLDEVLTKNLSDMSLESMHGLGYQGQHRSFPSLHQSSLDQIWKEPGNVSELPGASHSSPPSHSTFFGNAVGNSSIGNTMGNSVRSHSMVSSNQQTMLAALQAQQRMAVQTQQMQVQQELHHMQQMQHMQVHNNASLQRALGGLNSGMQNAMNSDAINTIGGSAQQLGRQPPQYGRAGSSSPTARRNHSDPALGGRLARNKMTPAAEAERKAHQDRMYGLNLNKIATGEDKRTTLMIKNIPNKYTQKMLLSLLEERFAGTYPFPFDFFYLPIDFKNKCNVGYAFINMTSPHAIPALVEDFHGKRWPKFNSEKVCAIAYGRIQGKLSLIQHFQNSSLLHEDKRCRPILFNTNGEIEAFPIGPAALANFSMKQHAMDLARGDGRP